MNRELSEAEADRRYIYGHNDGERRALQRQKKAGTLVSPYCNVYVRAQYFAKLNPADRMWHLIRTLALMRPAWVFAGASAALMLGLDLPWSMHADGCVFIATTGSVCKQSDPHLRRIHMPNLPRWRVGDVAVTDPARALVDCALLYSFSQTLPLFDSAAAQHVLDAQLIESVCDPMNADTSPVFNLLRYADGLSANGGESACRARIIEAGFEVPELQHEFVDPQDGRKYFTDFLWRVGNRMIVLEYDGLEKYENPEMTGGRSGWSVVNDERHRESALKRAGVTDIYRISSAELGRSGLLEQRLTRAGVPKVV